MNPQRRTLDDRGYLLLALTLCLMAGGLLGLALLLFQRRR